MFCAMKKRFSLERSWITAFSCLPFLHVDGAVRLPAADKNRSPNIVFILADDLGWQDTGFAGAKFFETPHLDRLAAEGMIFSDAYSGGPNCSPSRACLITGTYTPRHGIYQPGGQARGDIRYMRLLVPAVNRKNRALNRRTAEQLSITNDLDPAFVSIAEVLKPAGYTSARLGKWHLGDDTQGFDLSSSDGQSGSADNLYGDIDVAEKLTDRALRFIEETRDSPFFLYLSHWDVHTPHQARQEVVDKYQAKLDAIPQADRGNFNPAYAAMIEAVDTSAGRVMDRIDALGLAENTLIFFTSDNGGLDIVSQLEPFRGEKGSLFEGGIRVPACARWKGVIAPGSRCDTPITSVDFLPTFANLAGAALPVSQPVDGVDISPLFRGEPIAERSIFWHYPLYLQGGGLGGSARNLDIAIPGGRTYSWRAVPSTLLRRGPWKLFEFHEDNSVALYNLEDDPGEHNDLAREFPEITAELRAELKAWQKTTRAPIPSKPNPECVLE
jgi:arylsulfatase A-like enzyme